MSDPTRDMSRSGDHAFKALDLVVRRRLNGLLQGDRAGTRLGSGTEPKEVVRYRAGEDDVRRMDWNVTARTGEPHVWRPLAEHELDTWVLVDETPSMDFGTALSEKRDVAGWVAGSIGLLTDGPGNRVGVAHLTPTGLEWDAPLPGRVSARRTLRSVAGAPRADRRTDTTTLGEAITALERRQRRPGCGWSSATSSSPTAPPNGRSGGSRPCAGSVPATTSSSSRSSTLASSSSPTSGSSSCAIPRPGAPARSTRAPPLRRAMPSWPAAPGRGRRGRARRRRRARRRAHGLRLGPRPGPLHPVPAPDAPAPRRVR